MNFDLSSYNDIKINNSYLKNSYSNGSYPYIKGKKFESIFGGTNRIIMMDSYLNKCYISHMKKQDHIRQEKRIIDLIEKLDNKKVFNSLREDYLKEKMKISKGYYLNIKDKKKDYFSNLINLENYKEKLLNQYKSNNNPEGEFLYSLMNCLGCRTKKVFVKKVNKNIEILSKFKSFSKRKKQIEEMNSKKPKRRGSLQLFLKSINENMLSRNENNINYYNTSSNKIKKNSNLNKNHKIYTLDLNENETKMIRKFSHNNAFNITNSTNFNFTNYNNFYNIKENSNIIEDNNNESNKNNINNNKIEELHLDSLNNSTSEYNMLKMDEKINTITRKISSKRSTKLDLSSKKQKTINQDSSKSKNNTKTINSKNNINNINNNQTIYNKENVLNSSNEEENSEEMKMIDLKILNDKLNKKYGKIMKKFLQKIKTEERSIKENSNKLSESLFLMKRKHKKYLYSNNGQSKRNKTTINFYNRDNEKIKKNINNIKDDKEIKIGSYAFAGKSKYNLPKVNKYIYGNSIENPKDTFEILQNDLLNEVKKTIKSQGYSKKIKINGREIIDKLRLKLQVNKQF